MSHDQQTAVLSPNRQAVYNPGLLTDAEVRASFIVRQALLELLLEDIDATRPKGIPQHHLIVGQRGMGKTTLLRRLDVALREPGRSAKFIPLSFPEEQWALDRLSKLWLNCLDSLADTLEREGGLQDATDRVDDAVDVLTEENDDEELLAEAAERIFLTLTRELNRRPVLLVDNLDLVFERLETHEIHRLRASLTRAGAPILIGACVSPPEQTQKYTSAFYDHFKTHYLARLSVDEMRSVLLNLAFAAGNIELSNRLEAAGPRLRALHALTGGNPRTTVILFQIFTKGFSQEAYQDLEALLDMMTPLYKARFEELPSQGQVVMSALATNWEPASSAKLSEITRLDNRQLSPQLDRLKKAGLIEEVAIDPDDRVGRLPDKRSEAGRAGYQLAERFFNIWFLMRQATRRERRNLTFLTRFIECVHTPAERSAMARELLSRRPLSREERIYGLALEPAVAEYGLRYELHDHVQQEMVEASRALQEAIEELIDPAEIPAHRFAFSEIKARLKTVVSHDGGPSPDEFADAILGAPVLISARAALARQSLSPTSARELVEIARKDCQLIQRVAGKDAAEWLSNLLRRGTVVDFADPSQMSDAFRRADTREKVLLCARFADKSAKSGLDEGAWETIRRLVRPGVIDTAADWINWGYLLEYEFHQDKEAEVAYRTALGIDSKDATAWTRLGSLLFYNLNRFEEAEAAYRKAIHLAPASVQARDDLALLLQEEFEQYAEAETLYREALKLDPENAWTWTALGDLLHKHLGRDAEAEMAYRNAVRLSPKFAWGWESLAALEFDLGRFEQAESCFRKAVQNDPKASEAWFGLADVLHLQLNRFDEAEKAYKKTLDINPDHQPALNNLGLLLADCLGRPEESISLLQKAAKLDPDDIAPGYNLISVLRDQMNQRQEAEAILAGLPKSKDKAVAAGLLLHPALFAAYDGDWKKAARLLGKALDLLVGTPAIFAETFPGWMRATAVLLHLDYGSKVLELFRSREDDQRFRPWYEAIRAHWRGDRRYLRNIPAEMQSVAGTLFDEIQYRLRVLPAETVRWSSPKTPSPSQKRLTRKGRIVRRENRA